MTEQAREKNGEFASNGHKAEQATRKAGRFPVKAHLNFRSVGSHTGKNVAGNLGKAFLGVVLGAAGTFTRAAMRGQNHGRR